MKYIVKLVIFNQLQYLREFSLSTQFGLYSNIANASRFNSNDEATKALALFLTNWVGAMKGLSKIEVCPYSANPNIKTYQKTAEGLAKFLREKGFNAMKMRKLVCLFNDGVFISFIQSDYTDFWELVVNEEETEVKDPNIINAVIDKVVDCFKRLE